jgi:hypothetical protein
LDFEFFLDFSARFGWLIFNFPVISSNSSSKIKKLAILKQKIVKKWGYVSCHFQYSPLKKLDPNLTSPFRQGESRLSKSTQRSVKKRAITHSKSTFITNPIKIHRKKMNKICLAFKKTPETIKCDFNQIQKGNIKLNFE